MESTDPPHLRIQENKMRNGKIAKVNHDNYQINISRKQHVQRFLSENGFSIPEKQLGLKRKSK